MAFCTMAFCIMAFCIMALSHGANVTQRRSPTGLLPRPRFDPL